MGDVSNVAAAVSFGELPLDAIFCIFQYLPLCDLFNASIACRNWYSALQDSRLWEQLLFCKDDKTAFIVKCLWKAPRLKVVSFAKCSGIFDIYCDEEISQSVACDSCKMLELLHSPVSAPQLAAITRAYPRLSVVSFADSPLQFPDCLRSLMHLGSTLASLNLSYCCTLSDGDLILLADSFPHISELDIEGNPYITDEGVLYLLEKRGPKLTLLRVDGENLSDRFTVSLSLATSLKQFSIAYAENLSSHGFCVILSSLRCLESLRLHKVINLEDEEVAATLFRCSWLKSITYLELDDCQCLGDLSAIALSKICRGVQYLSMDWWAEISDVGIKEIVTNCSRLEYLSIVGAVRVVGQSSFDQNLAQLTPRLQDIRLEKCHSFDDRLFLTMTQALPHLRIINYYGELVERKK